MSVSAYCFGYLTPRPASKRVIKRYNDLITELFKAEEQDKYDEIPGQVKKIIK